MRPNIGKSIVIVVAFCCFIVAAWVTVCWSEQRRLTEEKTSETLLYVGKQCLLMLGLMYCIMQIEIYSLEDFEQQQRQQQQQ